LSYLINKSKPILCADDTSILCINPNSSELEKAINAILIKINEWFSVNLLTLNLNKTNCIYFTSKQNLSKNLNINYGDAKIYNTSNTKFLGLNIDNTLSRKDHINQLANKLSSAGYAIGILSQVMSQESLLMTYYAYVHSVLSYSIIFWGNLTHSDLLFKIKKTIVRIIMKAKNKDSCRPLFRLLNILPFYSQYILSITIFLVMNWDIFMPNSDIRVHSIHARHGSDLHYPAHNLTKAQKGVSYSGIKVFNYLPHNIKNLSNDSNKFKHALKSFLLVGSFYSLDEYFGWSARDDLGSYKQ
jgi:hypothetical protein